MRSLLLIILTTIINISIYSQFRLGVGGSILTGNKYYSYQVGPSIIAEYSLREIPISLSSSIGVHISELSKDYLPGYNNTVFNLCASINYYPITWVIKPYLGLGVIYNSNSFETGGMPAVHEGNIVSLTNVDNNISAELKGGFKFSADSPINFYIEVAQTFSNSAYLVTYDVINDNIIKKTEVSIFNSFFTKLGILFKI